MKTFEMFYTVKTVSDLTSKKKDIRVLFLSQTNGAISKMCIPEADVIVAWNITVQNDQNDLSLLKQELFALSRLPHPCKLVLPTDINEEIAIMEMMKSNQLNELIIMDHLFCYKGISFCGLTRNSKGRKVKADITVCNLLPHAGLVNSKNVDFYHDKKNRSVLAYSSELDLDGYVGKRDRLLFNCVYKRSNTMVAIDIKRKLSFVGIKRMIRNLLPHID